MFTLSSDPVRARREMNGLIFYLTTFSYIDGEFDPEEVAFIRQFIRRVVERRVDDSRYGGDPEQRASLIERFTADFESVLTEVRRDVAKILSEAVAEAEEQERFVSCKLKQRCFEVFQAYSPEVQKRLIETADELLMADGQAHPAELELRQELLGLLHQRLEIPYDVPEPAPRPIEVVELESRGHPGGDHSYFSYFEHPYSADAGEARTQIAADWELVKAALEKLDQQRRAGQGKLQGRRSVDHLVGEPPFLDGNVAAIPPREGRRYELTVLGDTHGCYSCLKAAIMQSRFFEKLAAFREDPESNPDPKLVLLGDYLDRGLYGINGVLRVALHLFVGSPEHVYVLRGNHEMFIEHEGMVHSAVRPAESIESIRPHASKDQLLGYAELFESLPTMLLFGRTLFVHGGIPRDALIKERVRDLAGLDDPEVRFQMLWSDPSVVDVIPRSLQDESYRFGFGRLQCQGFLRRLGCHTLIRGHDRVEEGFRLNFDDGQILAATLFSSGGSANRDLPIDSNYREITPKALTLKAGGGLDDPVEIEVWPIDYRAYNEPERNRFYG